MFVPTMGRCSCGFGDRGRRRRVTSPSAGPPTTPPCGHDLRPRDPRRRFRTATEVVFVPTAWRLRRLRVVVSERPRPAGNLGGGGRAPAVQDRGRLVEGDRVLRVRGRVDDGASRTHREDVPTAMLSTTDTALPARTIVGASAVSACPTLACRSASPARAAERNVAYASALGAIILGRRVLRRPDLPSRPPGGCGPGHAPARPRRRRSIAWTPSDDDGDTTPDFAAVGFRPADLRRNAAVMEDLVLPAQHLLTNYSGLRMRGHIRANTPDDLQARWWSTLGGGGGAFAARADVGPCAGRRIGSNARSSICGPTSPTTPPSSRAPSRRLPGNTFPGWASPTSMTSWWRWRMVAGSGRRAAYHP